MKIFLKLKHWQMFLVWIFASIQMQVFIKTDIWYISSIIYFVLIFGWIYSIGKILNKKNPEIVKKLNIWSIICIISLFPFFINLHNIETENYIEMNKMISIAAIIITIVSIVNIALISSKSLKQKEENKELIFSNYKKEFFLILYMIVGIWILQPKLNKIVE